MRRLFIAINLPEDTKDKIEKIVDNLKISVNQRTNQRESAAEIRFLRRENWHLTLTFLGYQPDEKIPAIIESTKQTIPSLSYMIATGNKTNGIKIDFEKIILAPPGKSPRMVWLAGAKETSKILGQIKNDLENNLIKNGVRFEQENREYNAHITLVRFSTPIRNYENIQKYEKELLNYQITRLPISFTAQSLDMMESHLKRSGAEYETLSSLTFSNK